MRRALFIIVLALVASACSGNVFDLEVGQCFDDPPSFDEVANVDIVECSEPHDNEIYLAFDLADGSYPGEVSVEETAVQSCLAGFEPFVGQAYETSTLDIGYLFPTSETWQQGDREIVCLVYDLSGTPLTGTVEGSGR